MIKKIAVTELCPNMYIHDLNCSWMEHPFLRKRFLLTSRHDIEKILKLGIRHVFINTDLGLDIGPMLAEETEPEARCKQESNLRDIGRNFQRPKPLLSMQEEILRARRIFSEANSMAQTLLLDCRWGKQIDLNRINPIIEAISGSVARNPDALLSLLRIKQADQYTYQHSVAVSALLISFGRTLEIDKTDIQQLGVAGLLHDIGKMKVSHHILDKSEKLDKAEFQVLKNHVGYGYQILKRINQISPIIVRVTTEHHERYDGSGYPRGLRGDKISLEGQMAGIVDVYDELSSSRHDYQGMEPVAVLKKLLAWGGSQFDPALIHSFIRTVGIYPVGTLVRLENNYLAVVLEQNHDDLLRPKVRVIFNAHARSYIPVRDYDLAKPGAFQRIIGSENPATWHIDPYRHLY